MLDILKFTFETYSHFWGMVLLMWLVTGGTRSVISAVVSSTATAIVKAKQEWN